MGELSSPASIFTITLCSRWVTICPAVPLVVTETRLFHRSIIYNILCLTSVFRNHNNYFVSSRRTHVGVFWGRFTVARSEFWKKFKTILPRVVGGFSLTEGQQWNPNRRRIYDRSVMFTLLRKNSITTKTSKT